MPTTAAWSSPSARASKTPVSLPSAFTDYRAAIHVHSLLSHDSRATVDEIVTAAKKVGVRVIMFTEHPAPHRDYFKEGHRGMVDGVLLIPGAEYPGLLAFPKQSVPTGSDADPQAQRSAVRAVLKEIGADNVPELVVINKIDDADPVALKALQLRERDSVLVSARTGEGIDALRAVIEERLPERDQLVLVSVPYSRGDLVARAHAAGEVAREEHGPDGTLLEARVPPELAFELKQYAVV